MYHLLALLTGIVISVMVSINGELTQIYGTYCAAVIIHIVGVIFAYLLCIAKKDKIYIKKVIPIWCYLGGAIGVLTTLFNNYAFGHISMTSIVALGLLGQSITSIIIDSFGWFEIKKRPIKKSSLCGFVLSFVGIVVMLDKTIADAFVAIIVSLSAGVTVVLSRTVNSQLSRQTSALVGSFINHLVGLPICILLMLVFQKNFTISSTNINPWIFFGGILGVFTVLLFNITVPQVSSFNLTLLSFIGQIFTGIFLDLIFDKNYSKASFIGSIIIAIGLFLTMVLESRTQKT